MMLERKLFGHWVARVFAMGSSAIITFDWWFHSRFMNTRIETMWSRWTTVSWKIIVYRTLIFESSACVFICLTQCMHETYIYTSMFQQKRLTLITSRAPLKKSFFHLNGLSINTFNTRHLLHDKIVPWKRKLNMKIPTLVIWPRWCCAV